MATSVSGLSAQHPLGPLQLVGGTFVGVVVPHSSFTMCVCVLSCLWLWLCVCPAGA